jgi:hypothetical protein
MLSPMHTAFALLLTSTKVAAKVAYLEDDNFHEVVFDPSNDGAFVKFFAPWCTQAPRGALSLHFARNLPQFLSCR